MQLPKDINEYLRAWAPELGERILTYPPLHGFDDAAPQFIGQLLRKPFPAQTLAMMGVVKRWNEARGAAVIAECGTGKTLISLGAVHVHSDRRPFTVLAMVPPQLVEKWAREAFLTLPRVRVFFIDGLRTPTNSVGNVGVNEVRLRHGRIKSRRALYSALWQADGKKILRFAPVDFIGRYMPDFFDYAIADEVHELKGDTAQGNALGTLAGCAQHTVVLTGTLLGGYADEVLNILFRMHPAKMVQEGFEYGEVGTFSKGSRTVRCLPALPCRLRAMRRAV